MRILSFCVLLLTAISTLAVSRSEAGPIILQAYGTTDASNVVLTPIGSGMNMIFPSGNWTQTGELVANNVGLTSTTAISFAGATVTAYLPGYDSPFVFPSLVTFTTAAGSFSFDAISARGDSVGVNPITNAENAVLVRGILSGGGFDPTDAFVALLFNSNGSYGNAAWLLETDAVPVPEPSSLILAGLGVCALVWHARRRPHV
jgi:hypothetical protein